MNPFSNAMLMRRPPPKPVYRRPALRGLGATAVQTGAEVTTLAVATYSAASAIAAGAAAGSVVGPIGAAVGACAAIVAGLLAAKPNTAAHIGAWDGQLVNALAALPAPNGIGRQFAWNSDSNGLTQMMVAILATGLYMNWDTQILANYDVCAHWAMTFATLAQTVATAGCKAAAGASVTVSITSQPGGPVGAASFTFKNPGIAGGPENFAANAIMGPSGAMVWLFNRWQIAGTAAQSKSYASLMGNNAYAQKVFALMTDYVAAQVAPAAATTTTTTPNVSSAISSGASAGKTAVATATSGALPMAAPVPAATSVPAYLLVVSGKEKYYPAGYSSSLPSGGEVLNATQVASIATNNLWAVTPKVGAFLLVGAGNKEYYFPAGYAATLPSGAETLNATQVASITKAKMWVQGTAVPPSPPATVAAGTTPAAPPVKVPTTPTPVAVTSTGTTVTDADVAHTIAAAQSSGTDQTTAVNSALNTLESQGVDTSDPNVQQAVSNAVSPGLFGLSNTELLIGGLVLIGGFYFLTKK